MHASWHHGRAPRRGLPTRHRVTNHERRLDRSTVVLTRARRPGTMHLILPSARPSMAANISQPQCHNGYPCCVAQAESPMRHLYPDLAEELLHPRGETTSPTRFGNSLAACQALCQHLAHLLSHLPVDDRALKPQDDPTAAEPPGRASLS